MSWDARDDALADVSSQRVAAVRQCGQGLEEVAGRPSLRLAGGEWPYLARWTTLTATAELMAAPSKFCLVGLPGSFLEVSGKVIGDFLVVYRYFPGSFLVGFPL